MATIIKDTQLNEIHGNNIVIIGGCFDILHPGHLEFIRRSKKEGDILVLLLESDENIARMKGVGHPINSQGVRANNLSHQTEVDVIVLLTMPESDEYYYNLVKSIRPAIIAVTENDPLIEVKKDQASRVNGKVVAVMKRDVRYSTTAIINRNK